MIYSGDVSQLFAAQNQMFSGQNAFANQIGIASPQMGMGAWGSASPPGSSYNYGSGGLAGAGYGGGNRFASSAMSGIGASASFGAMGLGALSMSSKFSFLTPLVDPISMGMAGFRAGGIMGAAGAASVPLAIGAYAAAQVNGFMNGGMQQAGVNSALGGSNFINPASRTGMGFNRQDASAIGQSIRQLSEIPELLTSMGELTKMIPRLRASGVMTGVHDATEFSRRFKETIHTIRDVAQILGTSMDEAEKVFSSSRSMGFMGRRDQLQNTLNAQLSSGLTGMSIGQVMGLQGLGAQTSFANGGTTAAGATSITALSQAFGSSLMHGRINEAMVQNATGMTGTQGIAAASSMAQNLFLNMSKTAPGMALLMGLSNKDGTGINQDALRALNSNSLTMDQIKGMGRGVNKLGFMRNKEQIANQLAGSVDVGAFMNTLGGDDNRAGFLLQQLTGASSAQQNLMLGMRGSMGDVPEAQQLQEIRGQELAIRRRTDPDAFFRRLKTRIHKTLVGGAEAAGADFQNAIAESFERAMDDIAHRHVLTLSKTGAAALASAARGSNRKDLDDIMTSGLRAPASGSIGLMQRIGGSELVASLTRGDFDTGRSPDSEMHHTLSLFGRNMQLAQSVAAGKYMTSDANAIDAARRVAMSIPGIDQMNDSARNDALRSAFTSMIANGAGSSPGRGLLMRTGAATAKTMGNGTDIVGGIIAATSVGKGPLSVNFNGLLDQTSNNHFQGVVARENAKNDAISTLKKKLSAQSLAIVTGNPTAVRLAFDPKAAAALDTMDADAAADELKVSLADVNAAKQLRWEVRGKNADAEVSKAIEKFHEAERAGDYEALRYSFTQAAKGMDDTGVGSGTVFDVIHGLKTNLTAAHLTSQNSNEIFSSVEKAMGLTGKGSRNALLANAGGLRSTLAAGFALSDALSSSSGRRNANVDSLKRITNLSELEVTEILKRNHVAEGGRLTDSAIHELVNKSTKARVAGFLGGEGTTTTALSKDAQLLSVLKDLQTALSQNTTVLATFSPDKKVAEAAKAARAAEGGVAHDHDQGKPKT